MSKNIVTSLNTDDLIKVYDRFTSNRVDTNRFITKAGLISETTIGGSLQIVGGVLDSTLRVVETANGTDSALRISTSEASITGNLTIYSGTFYYVNQYTTTGDFWMSASGSTNVLFSNGSLNNFGMLQLGGTTNFFSAIKRNGAAIDFRLADDSGYSGITSSSLNVYQNSGGANQIVFGDQTLNNRFAQYLSGSTMYLYNYTTSLNVYAISSNGSFNFGNVVAVASARVQVDSTTQGFLPPRMTAAQASAIGTPADGLIVYVSSTDGTFTSVGLWCRVASAWTKL